ncbi:MAG: hypothetical protein P4L50_28320, partial [Anaerolineaceae bacterium]|nr:hypothetical protein [Anaerolineaceae bacterium]
TALDKLDARPAAALLQFGYTMGDGGASPGPCRYRATLWVSFVLGNPIRFNDPSSHTSCDECDGSGGGEAPLILPPPGSNGGDPPRGSPWVPSVSDSIAGSTTEGDTSNNVAITLGGNTSDSGIETSSDAGVNVVNSENSEDLNTSSDAGVIIGTHEPNSEIDDNSNDVGIKQEVESYKGNWYEATFDSVDQSIKYHFNEHPGSWSTPEEYTRFAKEFYKSNLDRAKSIRLGTGEEGVKISNDQYFRTYTIDGRIISFGLR